MFEMTTHGLAFFILPDLMAARIAFMLLPLPEIRIPRLTAAAAATKTD